MLYAVLHGATVAASLDSHRVQAHAQTFLQQQPIQIFVPVVSVANITEPTAFPPPPPVLDPVQDRQPFDTALGNLILNQFVATATVTPPPLQSALDLAYACPALLEFPTSVVVEAPRGCGADAGVRRGRWLSTGQVELMRWQEVCLPRFQVSAGPVVEYTVSNGDVFGYSRELRGRMELMDCGLRTLFTITEKVYRDKRGNGGTACEKFGSCDGTVYVKYKIFHLGVLMATTPYLTLFQDAFTWTSPDGVVIADISRTGGWTPREACPERPKTWLVKLNPDAPPPSNDISMRWPVVEALTMISLRDDLRENTGFVATSTCQWKLGASYFGAVVVLLGVSAVLTLGFYFFVRDRAITFCFYIENKTFPKVMRRQS